MKKHEEPDTRASVKDAVKALQTANQYMKQRNYSNAIVTLDNFIKLKDSLDRSIRLDMLLTVAFSYFYLLKYEESAEQFDKALDIIHEYTNEYSTEKSAYLK